MIVECDECGREFIGPEGGQGNAHWRLASHKARMHKKASPGADSPPPSADTATPSGNGSQSRLTVDVDLGLDKRKSADPALEAVRQRAEQLATFVVMGVFFLGQEEDAADIERGKEKWAGAVRDVAVHEEWLRKLCQGGEASERLMAWAKLLLATGAIALPIALRHGAVPPAIARFLAMAEGHLPTDAPGAGVAAPA